MGDEPPSKDSTGGLPGAGKSPGLLSALMAQPAQDRALGFERAWESSWGDQSLLRSWELSGRQGVTKWQLESVFSFIPMV